MAMAHGSASSKQQTRAKAALARCSNHDSELKIDPSEATINWRQTMMIMALITASGSCSGVGNIGVKGAARQ